METANPDISSYASFNDFFTRPLRGVHDPGQNTIWQ
jgi:phosphatidylserine decarboxylase